LRAVSLEGCTEVGGSKFRHLAVEAICLSTCVELAWAIRNGVPGNDRIDPSCECSDKLDGHHRNFSS